MLCLMARNRVQNVGDGWLDGQKLTRGGTREMGREKEREREREGGGRKREREESEREREREIDNQRSEQ